MKWIILQLTLNLIINYATGQTYVGCSFETVEMRFLFAASDFMRQNEEYHDLRKSGELRTHAQKFDYSDSLSAVYAQENLTYLVLISDIDTNKCSITCGFSCLIMNSNPFKEENNFQKLTHIAVVDSRPIIIAFSKKINPQLIDMFTEIRPLNFRDSAEYENFYNRYSFSGRKGVKLNIRCDNCTLHKFYKIVKGEEIAITYKGTLRLTKMIKNSFIFKKSAFNR